MPIKSIKYSVVVKTNDTSDAVLAETYADAGARYDLWQDARESMQWALLSLIEQDEALRLQWFGRGEIQVERHGGLKPVLKIVEVLDQ